MNSIRLATFGGTVCIFASGIENSMSKTMYEASFMGAIGSWLENCSHPYIKAFGTGLTEGVSKIMPGLVVEYFARQLTSEIFEEEDSALIAYFAHVVVTSVKVGSYIIKYRKERQETL